jgi:hypothetical protein
MDHAGRTPHAGEDPRQGRNPDKMSDKDDHIEAARQIIIDLGLWNM